MICMTETQYRITEYINQAINVFNEHEGYLISRDLSERCICAKFAMYLDRILSNSEFSTYIVDVEYNRGRHGNEYLSKRLGHRNIVVDLIVHKRGFDQENGFDNLICIEMKKAYKNYSLSSDMARLQTLTDNTSGFGYKAGFMIVADSNKITNEHILRIEQSYYHVDF